MATVTLASPPISKEKSDMNIKKIYSKNAENNMTNLDSFHGKRNDPDTYSNKKVMSDLDGKIGGDKFGCEIKVEMKGEGLKEVTLEDPEGKVKTILKRPDLNDPKDLVIVKTRKEQELNEWSILNHDINDLYDALNYHVKWASRLNESEFNEQLEKVQEKLKMGYYWEENILNLVKMEISVFLWCMVNNGVKEIKKSFIGFLDSKEKKELLNMLNDTQSLSKAIEQYEKSELEESQENAAKWENWCNKILNSRKYQNIDKWCDWTKMVKLRKEMEKNFSQVVKLVTDYPSGWTGRYTVEFKRSLKGMKFLLYNWGLKQGLAAEKAIQQAQDIMNDWSWSQMCNLLLKYEMEGMVEAEKMWWTISEIVEVEKKKEAAVEEEEEWDWRKIRTPLRDRAILEISWEKKEELNDLVEDMTKELKEIHYFTKKELKSLNHEEKCVMLFLLLQQSGMETNEAIIEIFRRPRIRDTIWYFNDLDALESLLKKEPKRIGEVKMLELITKGKVILNQVQASGQINKILGKISMIDNNTQIERRKHEHRFRQIKEQLEMKYENGSKSHKTSIMCSILENIIQSRIIKGGRSIKTAGQAIKCLEKYLSWEELLQWFEKDNESFNRNVRNIIKNVKYSEW